MRLLTLFAVALTAGGTQAASCPNSVSEWEAWGKKAVARLERKNYRTSTAQEIRDDWRRCTKTKKAPRCLQPLTDFVSAHGRHRDKGFSLAAEVSDVEYYKQVPFRDMMELPSPLNEPQFLRWMDGKTKDWDRALKRIEQFNEGLEESKKLRAFLYQSQHLGPPDDSKALGRFFVYIPHEHYDQYLQFALPHPIDQPPAKFRTIRGLSVVTIQTKDKKGNALPRQRAWFKDFWRLRSKTGEVTVSTRLKEKGSMENCTSCHKSALLPITPDPRTFDQVRFGKTLSWVNRQMNRHAGAHPAHYRPEAFGPALGPKSLPERTPTWMKTCAGDLTEVSRRRVQRRMACASCHNDQRRGRLSFPSGLRKQPETRKDLVHHYVITHQTMPKGARLTKAERAALVRCLKSEMYGGGGNPGLLPTYLLNPSCW